MTDKEKIEELEENFNSQNVLLESEKQMNSFLKKHIENLDFQITTQNKLMGEFCRKIADLRFRLKNL